MQEIQKQAPFQAQFHEESTISKGLQDRSPQGKASLINSTKQQTNISPHKKPQSQSKCCSFSDVFKRQVLRMIFIPLLIVLFLLTIALTFKQNNYQTNDYFYSKNIEINRKIRGVVPPLNETKQDIFGQYKIGLVQKFDLDNRRIFEGWKVEMWRNESMRISEGGKDGKCWALYKLKFYSSTIFIVKIQNHIYVDGANNSLVRNLEGQTQITIKSEANVNITEPSKESSQKNTSVNSTQSISTQKNNFTNPSNELTTKNSTNQSNQATEDQNTVPSTQKSYCSLDLWGKLNQILYESHIWTFAEDNFYLLEFSQLGDDTNGVLIMKMVEKYPTAI